MTENDQMRVAEARNSFTGKTLNDNQFNAAWNLSEILHAGIQQNASFYEQLQDYSHAYARTENFDSAKAKVILRDIFKARYGETMNQMRENILTREANLPETARHEVITHARMIEPMIREGETMPFYRAHDRAGGMLAKKLSISESGAKKLMKTTFQDVEGRDLYEVGKALEKEFHAPVREAERASRTTARSQTRKHSQQH